MLKSTIFSVVVIALLTINVHAQEESDQMPSRERWSQVEMQGTVTEIKRDTREITLMGSKGELTTITAGDEVERFDEIVVEDIITFEYWTYLKAEFREPTPEEIAEPLVVIADADRAPEDMAPAGVVGTVVKAVVTIEVLNRPYMLATVRGPRGNYLTIQMEDPSLIEKLHIGQVLILTYAEVIAVSLEKVRYTK